MKRIATFVEDGKVVGLVHGPDANDQSITVDGRVWRFDFDRMCGPLWLKANGMDARKNQCPPDRVWIAFDEWFAAWRASNPKSPT